MTNTMQSFEVSMIINSTITSYQIYLDILLSSYVGEIFFYLLSFSPFNECGVVGQIDIYKCFLKITPRICCSSINRGAKQGPCTSQFKNWWSNYFYFHWVLGFPFHYSTTNFFRFYL